MFDVDNDAGRFRRRAITTSLVFGFNRLPAYLYCQLLGVFVFVTQLRSVPSLFDSPIVFFRMHRVRGESED